MTPMDTFTIRTAASADLPDLVAIDIHAREDGDRRAFLSGSVERGECLAAFSEETLVGFIVLNHTFFGRGFVPLVVVAPSMRRQRIAQRLFKAAESRCRSAMLFTSTNMSNADAQRLFERMDFRPSGRIENLDVDDPELVYVKDVTRDGTRVGNRP